MEQLMTKEVLQVMDKVFQRNPQLFMDNFTVFRDTLEEREETGFKRGEDSGFKRGTLRSQQQMLIRQLHRKFKNVPASVVLRVESTQDRTQLESWVDEILFANSLAEMGLLPAESSHNGVHLDTNN